MYKAQLFLFGMIFYATSMDQATLEMDLVQKKRAVSSCSSQHSLRSPVHTQLRYVLYLFDHMFVDAMDLSCVPKVTKTGLEWVAHDFLEDAEWFWGLRLRAQLRRGPFYKDKEKYVSDTCQMMTHFLSCTTHLKKGISDKEVDLRGLKKQLMFNWDAIYSILPYVRGADRAPVRIEPKKLPKIKIMW